VLNPFYFAAGRGAHRAAARHRRHRALSRVRGKLAMAARSSAVAGGVRLLPRMLRKRSGIQAIRSSPAAVRRLILDNG